jgi:AraC-like DNA-binding protein
VPEGLYDRSTVLQARFMEQKAIDRLLEELRSSEVFREYEQAYHEVTHLPLVIRSINGKEAIDFNPDHEHDFCQFMRQHNDSCKTCIHVEQEHLDSAESINKTCFAGVHVTAVPIKVHQNVVGYLQTGEVLLENPSIQKLEESAKTLLQWGIKLSPEDIKQLLESGPILSPKQYEAVIKMLEIFARHISEVAAKVSISPELNEPDGIKKSRDYIQKHIDEKITLDQAASVANMSASHFCRVFKKATDMNFSEYVARHRVEKAKEMLVESNYTMAHIAYDCGFNSVTDFNRTFKKITGITPTDFRRST